MVHEASATIINKGQLSTDPWASKSLIMPIANKNCCKVLYTWFFLSTVTNVTVVTNVTTV